MRPLAASLVLEFLVASNGVARADACGYSVRGLNPLLTGPMVLAIGEDAHGTAEVPDAVGRLACHLLSQGLPVALAYEMPAQEQPQIDAYLASDGGASARAALVSGIFWQSDIKDGRASVGLQSLLEKVRRLRSHSRDQLTFTAMELFDPSQERDANMAAGVLLLRKAHPDAIVILVAGNNHTRIDASFALGSRLRREGVPLLSLVVEHPPGAAYSCQNFCGAHPQDGKNRGDESFAERTPIGHGMFDGRLYLPGITASPPAIPNGHRL